MKPVCQFRFVFVFIWFPDGVTLSSPFESTTPLRYYQGSDSSTSHQRQRSPWFSRLTFLMFRPQPRYAPDPRFIHHRNGISEFQTSPRMSKLVANIRVRSPTDHQFASGCSPPRLMATQLPSTTWLWFTMARTFTVLNSQAHSFRAKTRNPGSVSIPWIPAPRFRGDKLSGNDIEGMYGLSPQCTSAFKCNISLPRKGKKAQTVRRNPSKNRLSSISVFVMISI